MLTFGVETIVFGTVNPRAGLSNLEKVIKLVTRSEIDLIVSFDGSRGMDIAKLVPVMAG